MKNLKVILACLIYSISSVANATIILQFEDDSGLSTSYQEDGFSVDSLSGRFRLISYDRPNGQQLYLSNPGDIIRISQIGGGFFDFTSVLFTDSNSRAIGTISSSNGGLFNLPGGNPGLLGFSGTDWESVSYIDIARTGGFFFDIDNVEVVASKVPAPASIFLFILGLLGLGARRIKHRRGRESGITRKSS